MLLREVILENVQSLKGHTSVTDTDPEKGEAWAGKQYGAQFKVVRAKDRIYKEEGGTADLLYLILRGHGKGQERLQLDFEDALGRPSLSIPSVRFRHPRMVIWKWNYETTKEF